MTYPMPEGVEHWPTLTRYSNRWRVMTYPMPEGVEHKERMDVAEQGVA